MRFLIAERCQGDDVGSDIIRRPYLLHAILMGRGRAARVLRIPTVEVCGGPSDRVDVGVYIGRVLVRLPIRDTRAIIRDDIRVERTGDLRALRQRLRVGRQVRRSRGLISLLIRASRVIRCRPARRLRARRQGAFEFRGARRHGVRGVPADGALRPDPVRAIVGKEVREAA